MVSTKIILWTGMLLATAFATTTTYGFLSNSYYKILRCLRFPTIFLFPTILYFIMEFNYQEIIELINKFWPFFEGIYKHFDIQKVEKFIEKLPLPFWLITVLTICVWGARSITTSFFKEYFQQNEYASQSTSAVLYTVNSIATSLQVSFQAYLQTIFAGLQACFQTIFAGLQACFQTIFAGLQACFQTIFAGLQACFQTIFAGLQAYFQTISAGLQACFQAVFTGNASHFPIMCLCILFCMGIILFIASLLFSKGNQRWAFVAIAFILASPGYILLVRWTINF
ncbi:uncharacterized protein Bfra_009168 [Botrytis fragariae]|uniref:Transmembrane protein n=1 Tax=Botrytis fragariae TaxID=1964551 RepID=A0A8H6AQL1_9HELO|nr:uncharacterized protein Bfra_009168 [Botrytis fragariae]KAF5872138.1 hypothetical protein Bfra_009168 [Botrytis fragariae]